MCDILAPWLFLILQRYSPVTVTHVLLRSNVASLDHKLTPFKGPMTDFYLLIHLQERHIYARNNIFLIWVSLVISYVLHFYFRPSFRAEFHSVYNNLIDCFPLKFRFILLAFFFFSWHLFKVMFLMQEAAFHIVCSKKHRLVSTDLFLQYMIVYFLPEMFHYLQYFHHVSLLLFSF